MVSRCAGGLAAMTAFSFWIAACAETPPANPQPYAVIAGHPARLHLEMVASDPHCASPYPISQLRAKLVAGDGKVYATPIFSPRGPDTAGLPLLDPAEVSGNVSFGQVGADLVYVPPVDLLPFVGGDLIVNAWLTRQPAVKARLVIHPRFDCLQYVNLAGRPGWMGSTSHRGSNGEAGPYVRVALGYLTGPGSKPLVIVRIDDPRGLRARTVFSPEGPPLQIFLDGGSGGMGGVPLVQGYGMNRLEIPAGPGGDGGDGGAAEIFYDEAEPQLERKVVIFNRGGAGGVGGGGNGRPGRAGPLPRTTPAQVRRLFSDELAHGVPIRIHGALEPAANQSI